MKARRKKKCQRIHGIKIYFKFLHSELRKHEKIVNFSAFPFESNDGASNVSGTSELYNRVLTLFLPKIALA